jgi:hypothetical protein
MYQLDLTIDGSGLVTTHPVFASNPDKMRLNNMGVHIGDYVRTDATISDDANDSASYPTDTAACMAIENGVAPTPTEDVFVELLVGVWSLCGTPSVFGTDEAGLEISADGHWWKLQSDESGGMARIEGWNNEGTWETIDTSVMNGPGVYQLNLHIDGSGTVITMPVFASNPDKMRLSNEGVYTGDYVRTTTSEPAT